MRKRYDGKCGFSLSLIRATAKVFLERSKGRFEIAGRMRRDDANCKSLRDVGTGSLRVTRLVCKGQMPGCLDGVCAWLLQAVKPIQQHSLLHLAAWLEVQGAEQAINRFQGK